MKCLFRRSIGVQSQAVWRLLNDLQGMPDRFPQFEGWTIAADPRGTDLVSLSHEKLNRDGGIEYVARLTVIEPGRELNVEYLEADLTPMGQTATYRLEPAEDGTRAHFMKPESL